MAQQVKDYLINNPDKIRDVLESVGCHKIWDISSTEIRCAHPQGENRTSISVNTETLYSAYFAGGETVKGDIIKLIQHIRDEDFVSSLRFIRSILGLSRGKTSRNTINPLDKFNSIRRKSNSTANINDLDIQKFDKNVLNEFVMSPHISLLKEGIMPITSELFSVAFDPKLSRIVFPHFNFDSTEDIVGITGRTTRSDEEIENLMIPKYWNYIKGYQKMSNLYGFSHSIPYIEKNNMLIVFEAEKSVLKQHTMTRNQGYSCSVGGHDLSDMHVQIILNNTPSDTEIVIAFDRDVQDMKDKDGNHIGEEYLINTCNKLSKYRKTSYIFDKYNILGPKDAPVDKGIKVWSYLLKYRKKA